MAPRHGRYRPRFMALHELFVGVIKDGMAQNGGEMDPRGLKGATSQSGTRFLKSEAVSGSKFSILKECVVISIRIPDCLG